MAAGAPCRTATGQILDEYRLVDDKGQTFYVTATIRNYNAIADRWELIGMDSQNGLQDFGTAQRVGQEVHIEQRFGVAGGKSEHTANPLLQHQARQLFMDGRAVH